jgi:hypothetical protein
MRAGSIRTHSAISIDSNNLPRRLLARDLLFDETIVRSETPGETGMAVSVPATHILRRRDAPRRNTRFGWHFDLKS